MSSNYVKIQEVTFGDTVWVRLRSRDDMVLYLRPAEAAELGQRLTSLYGEDNDEPCPSCGGYAPP